LLNDPARTAGNIPIATLLINKLAVFLFIREIIMSKRIVICADGTWNRPEIDIVNNFPTNVLKIALSIKPIANGAIEQQVY